jgi:hypothetical protein
MVIGRVGQPCAAAPGGATAQSTTLTPIAIASRSKPRPRVRSVLGNTATAGLENSGRTSLRKCDQTRGDATCPLLMLWTAPPPARKCQGRRSSELQDAVPTNFPECRLALTDHSRRCNISVRCHASAGRPDSRPEGGSRLGIWPLPPKRCRDAADRRN